MRIRFLSGRRRAQRRITQHQAYCAALEECGLELIRLDPDPNHPDSTFVEDTAVIFGHGRASTPLSRAILTNPGASSRASEVNCMRGMLAKLFPSLSEIKSPGTLDGGDVCQVANHFFIGISERTNEEGARQLARLLSQLGYTSSLIDIRSGTGVPPVKVPLLHLKSGIAYLGDRRLLLVDELIDRIEFQDYEIIRITPDEQYSANCVRINDFVLIAAGYAEVAAALQRLGYQTIALEMSEFQKMDGGLSCLSLRF
jgi:dimethylargininase